MQKQKWIKLFALSFCLIILLFSLLFSLSLRSQAIHAQSADELENQLREKRDQINELQQQLDQAKTQEKTLKSQLQVIDTQTKLTLAKIDAAEFQIKKLTTEIEDLSGRITRLSGTLDKMTEVLLERIIRTYKYGNFSGLELFLSSKNFSDLLERYKYIQIAQEHDKKVLYQLQATKVAYNDQKDDKASRQSEQQKLKKDLENYKIELAQQKTAKDELLRTTQNDEKKFQQLIAQLQADLDSISRALAGKGVKLGPVKKGERIAGVGNSGCSTGPHLHLEVMTPAHIDNGQIVGRENKVDPLPYIQNGTFPKPVADYTGNDCSQGGSCHIGDVTTRFGQVYFLGTHTGLDIADSYGSSIYAAGDGDAYAIADSKPCYLTGTAGKGIMVDHHNDMVTLYWHIP